MAADLTIDVLAVLRHGERVRPFTVGMASVEDEEGRQVLALRLAALPQDGRLTIALADLQVLLAEQEALGHA